MIKFCVNLIFFLLISLLLQSQTKKSVEAVFITSPLKIDAVLDEDAYNRALPAKDFQQLQPYNGKPSFQPSEVYFFYDNDAIYVGAKLYDSRPDSIFNYLTQRDNIGISDYFGVYIDPYNQGQLAYGFFITPAGVQSDIKASKSDGDSEDGNWNAVWESKTRIGKDGWFIEMRIPFEALRFSDKQIDTWGMNMFRNIRRYNSNNSWNFVDRKVSGFIHQQGELKGIKNIKPPVRLSFNPYLATYFEPQREGNKMLYKGGLDVKYGINDAFTLDMMLIPDFGQIQSDDQELNLSPFELYYDEKRQFFTEGTEMFKRANIFYSRRIGARPVFSSKIQTTDDESVQFSPGETQLINATKISGRTRNDLGIGFLNAMSLNAFAEIKVNSTGEIRKELVQPFTNYNIMVVDKSLKNNSYISLINTNMSMAGNPFSANVTATEFEFRDKTKTYALKGQGGFSTRGAENKDNGFFGTLTIEKNQGKLFWGLSEKIYSDKYNPNDLGYLQRNNRLTTEAWVYYQIIEPFGIFREVNGDIWYNYNRMYNPNTLFDNETGFDLKARFKNNYLITSSGNFNTDQFDYYEPRVPGRFYINPYSLNFDLRVETDFRKPFYIAIEYDFGTQPTINSLSNELEFDANWRIGQRVNLEYSYATESKTNENGFTSIADNSDIIFASRDVNTIVNTLNSTFVLNNKSGLSLRGRHYWTGVKNKAFYTLLPDGKLSNPYELSSSKDQNYNAFTIDLIYRWIFSPGSELSLAWKTTAYLNNQQVVKNYFDNLTNSWQNQMNSLSVKILYYLNYNQLKRKS